MSSVQLKKKSIVEKAIDQLNANNDFEALHLFDQAFSEGVALPGLNYGRAVALARLGQVNKAVTLLKRMLFRIPNHEKARKLLDELTSSSFSDFRSTRTFTDISKKDFTRSSWLPITLYPDDVFIVSYPKSGNTWLRFLLANLLEPKEEINFHTVHNYVPEVGRQEEIIKDLERPRIMKSHAPYIREYPKVVYLVRDGRDVYVSFYFQRLNELPAGCEFEEFIKRQDHYPCTWGAHVSSWISKIPCSNLLLIRYEDLIHDSFKQLNRVVRFLSLDRSEDQVSVAIEKSSFDNMKRLELVKGRRYKNQGPKSFMRKGKSGDWKNYFGQGAKDFFKSREGDLLVELGYAVNNRW